MWVTLKKPFLHYKVGKQLEITTELYNGNPDVFEVISQVKYKKLEKDEHNKRAQPKMENRRRRNSQGD
jgi:hypothetical protein